MLSERQGQDDPLGTEQALRAAAVSGGVALLRQDHKLLPGQLMVVSSFGTESAVLLALAADIDPGLPVVFLQTGKHSPATLEYRESLADRLELSNVVDAGPASAALAASDSQESLWHCDPDACYRPRKVTITQRTLAPCKGWISGRKRNQSSARQQPGIVERDGTHLKINPLMKWNARQVEAEMVRLSLPHHPLIAEGHPSIGCEPCTARLRLAPTSRNGRWMGTVERGIHSVVTAG